MEPVFGIRLRKTNKVIEFTPGGLELCAAEYVVVDTEKGIVLGQVMYGPLQRDPLPPDAKPVIRKADIEDLAIMKRNRTKEEEAYLFCLERIKERSLPMKLVDVEYILSGGKAVFYFTSDGRVDFRTLVKDLAQQFHTRIEMRQIGVRDESKMLGGIGPCGRELCCSCFLKSFEPVSIRMAKDQNLALNPQKVSGLCGRLMCCLTYEQATYEAIWDQIPKIGKRVVTPQGEGKVMSVDIKNQKVRTLIGDEMVIFTIEEIRELNKDMVRGGDRGQDRGRPRDRGPEGDRRPRDGGQQRQDRGPRPQGGPQQGDRQNRQDRGRRDQRRPEQRDGQRDAPQVQPGAPVAEQQPQQMPETPKPPEQTAQDIPQGDKGGGGEEGQSGQ
jgi:cell fate regulator YaaT (PSP1 superfamily)